MLTLVEQAEVVRVQGAADQRLAELIGALEHERRLVEDLRQALLRQREGVAADRPEIVEDSVQAIGRTLLTIEEARRRRTSLIALITGTGGVPLAELEAFLGRPLPEAFARAREALRRAAETTAMDLAINQTVLRRALEAGDAFLQQLFSSTADPMPVYAPSPRAAEPRAGSVLLDRTA
ncbi:MAG TPA: hypothetical protein VEB59_13415 [Gemmatimonadales bacterium]|nr:hypothetical protein [Gemmatimonadales bacterium]